MKKLACLLSMTIALSFTVSGMSFGGTWYERSSENGIEKGYAFSAYRDCSGWQWVDDDKNGVFECYYFKDGIAALNTMIEGYTVDGEGRWTVDGAIQQRSIPAWAGYKDMLLGEDFRYPKFELQNAEASAEVSKLIDVYALGLIPADSIYPEEITLDYDLFLGNDNYVSSCIQDYWYGGGAHGETTDHYFTITAEGPLQITDLGGQELINAINANVQSQLRDRNISEGLYLSKEPEQIAVDYSDGFGFMILPDGLHVLFTTYEIASHADGNIDVCVPYSAIYDHLNDYAKGLINI